MPEFVEVSIGRISGPSTDEEVSAQFDPADVETIKDVLSMVNAASKGKERWYVQVDDGPQIIPEVTAVPF